MLGQRIDGSGGSEAAEVRQAIETVPHIIEQHGESRFVPIEGQGAGREWWMPPEIWKVEICHGLDSRFVARALADRGLLRVQGGLPIVPTRFVRGKGKTVGNGFFGSERDWSALAIFDPGALQETADRFDRQRGCGCRRLATLAVPRSRPGGGAPDGRTRWLCHECFAAERLSFRTR